MTVADASLWISYLVPDDVHHHASRDWFRRLSPDAALIEPTRLLVEITAGIARRVDDLELVARLVAAVRAEPRLILVSMTDDLVDDARDLAGRLWLRAGDAIYVALARRHGVPLVTWDREQRERSAGVATASSPAEH